MTQLMARGGLSPDLIIHTAGFRAIQSRSTHVMCSNETGGCPNALLHGLIQRVEDRSQSGHAGAGRGPAAAYRVCAGKPAVSKTRRNRRRLRLPRLSPLSQPFLPPHRLLIQRRPLPARPGTGPDRRGRSGVSERCRQYHAGKLQTAKADFDRAVDLMLTSNFDLRTEPQLRTSSTAWSMPSILWRWRRLSREMDSLPR
jgi:hypothetical protein